MAVVPVSGSTYFVQNLAFPHILDNRNSDIDDGNPTLAWPQNNPGTNNQVWRYLQYPSTSGQTVFTIQCIDTLGKEPSGMGGYVRVDTSTNGLVQGGAPMAWRLVPFDNNATEFKFLPFDPSVSQNGKLVATDINSVISQVQLTADSTMTGQTWTFLPQTPF